MFGRYQLLQKLATGGMAEIYLARQQGPEGFAKLLVIKRILPHLAGNDEFVKMFLDEARIAARLNHANVVQIFDLGAIDEHFFIAMEYLHGEDARRVWKQADKQHQPLPVPLACRIVMDACAGLDYAHKKLSDTGTPLNIVHRDVSPQNIIVTFEGGVKVVDFGIAKAADQSSVTRSGVVKGKYSYMSPEQAAGKRVDARTDQFALGIVLYELVSGERLFKRNTDIETLKAVERCQVPPPSQVSRAVPESLDPIIMRALERDLDQRYPDCRAFQLALESWLLENRLPSSSSQLAGFLGGIYAERLDQEKRLGHPLWDDDSGSGGKPHEHPGVPTPPRTRTPSHQTAVAKKVSSPAMKSLPRIPSSGAAALALSGPRPTVEGPPPPPPVRTSFNLARASSQGGSRARPLSGPVSIGEDDLIDSGSTLAEMSQTLSTTNGSVPSAVARRQSRRSLVVGLGAGAVVVFFGVGLFAFMSQAQVAPPVQTVPANLDPVGAHPDAATTPELTITTEPPGAEVAIDGAGVGRSPVAVHSFPVGAQLAITARLDGYGEAKLTHAVARDAALTLKLTRLAGPTAQAEHVPVVRSEGTLALDSTLPLTGTLDGKPVAIPGRVHVAAGAHTLVVRSASLDYARSFDLRLRAGETVTPQITPATGKVMVVIANGGGGELTINGISRGAIPAPPLSLAEGTHTLEIGNEELGKHLKRQVLITPNNLTKVPVNLEE
jgi:serine/threonine protein kinase